MVFYSALLGAVAYVAIWAAWCAVLLCLPVAGMCAFVLLNEFFIEPLMTAWRRQR